MFTGPLELTDINKKPNSYHKLETNINAEYMENVPTQQMSDDNEYVVDDHPPLGNQLLENSEQKGLRRRQTND